MAKFKPNHLYTSRSSQQCSFSHCKQYEFKKKEHKTVKTPGPSSYKVNEAKTKQAEKSEPRQPWDRTKKIDYFSEMAKKKAWVPGVGKYNKNLERPW